MNSFRFLVISLSSVIQAELIMNSKGPIMKLLAETKVITTNGINAALFSGWKRQHGSTIMKKKPQKKHLFSFIPFNIWISFIPWKQMIQTQGNLYEQLQACHLCWCPKRASPSCIHMKLTLAGLQSHVLAHMSTHRGSQVFCLNSCILVSIFWQY